MKKITALAAILLLGIGSLLAQKLEKTEVDEFDGSSTTCTTWEKIMYSKKGIVNARFMRVEIKEKHYTLNIKILQHNSTISKDDKLILKLEDGSFYTLYSMDYSIPSQGAGATSSLLAGNVGVVAFYHSEEDPTLSTLAEKKVTKIRIYSGNSFIEDDVKPKFAEVLIKAAKLIHE